MLRALRTLLRRGGLIAYTTIYIAPGLTSAQRRRARRSGPPAVASSSEQLHLLASAGFVDVECTDVSEEFAKTGIAWMTNVESNLDALAELDSRGAVELRQRERKAHLSAVQDGLLRRGLFSARRPTRRYR